jgi:hypothetical protein
MPEPTLSDRTVRTVKATAPILRERGVEITRRMYEILFVNEEIKGMFNQSHHGQEGTQPRSLALAVHAYADNIDRLGELGSLIGGSRKSTWRSTSSRSTTRTSDRRFSERCATCWARRPRMR